MSRCARLLSTLKASRAGPSGTEHGARWQTKELDQLITVLLLSPRAGIDPANGDVTYTEQLLAHPPAGVRYVPYDEALRDGTLQERFRRRPTESGLQALRRDGDAWRFTREALVNRVRGTGLLFREPFRHFSVQAGAFDAVHVHVFSVRIDPPPGVPLVLSNSIRIDALYRDAFGHSPAVVERRRRVDIWLAQRTAVTHCAYGHLAADAVVCFSEHLRRAFLVGDHNPYADYVVIPPGVEPDDRQVAPVSSPLHTGFVGEWHAKGGDTVLSAHRALRARGVPARLTIVGSEPRLSPEESIRLGVTWLPRQPHDVLLQEIIPSFTAFAYPSRFDGLPLTLLEVMARGVPVVVSDYGALPEVVDGGRAGLIVPRDDAAALEEALLALTDEAVSQRLSEAARRRVRDHYDSSMVATSLGRLYEKLIDERRTSATGSDA